MPDSIGFSRRPVLVLGASGFIGRRVVAALESSAAYRPVAASRRSAVRVDANDGKGVRTALRDVDYVVNCVAGNDPAVASVLCDAARPFPPRRIVHLSSMAVYGAATGVVREDTASVEPVSGYGQAKRAGERILLDYVADGGDAVILRPTCVFGPESPQWTTRIAALLRAGRIGDLGAEGDGCCNLAFIDDVVAAIVGALGAADARGRAFNVSSSASLTWNEFLVMFGKALGATPVRRISARRLRIETKLLAPVRRVAGMAVKAPWTQAITPSLAALWRQDIRIDSGAAADVLGMPATPVARMIEAVLRTGAASQLVS